MYRVIKLAAFAGVGAMGALGLLVSLTTPLLPAAGAFSGASRWCTTDGLTSGYEKVVEDQ